MIPQNDTLNPLFESGLLSALDLSFGRMIGRLSGLEEGRREKMELLAALLSQSCSAGKSTRLDLRSLEPEPMAALLKRQEIDPKEVQDALALLNGMTPESWLDLLKAAPSIAGTSGLKPLLFDETEKVLYLLRLRNAESRVAGSLQERAKRGNAVGKDAETMIEKIFPLYKPISPDLQKEAAKTVASGALAIITGGPGTGKTSSVAAALCALLAQRPDLRIGLCAPTGKAAAQLLASIQSQRELFRRKGVATEILERLPDKASTIHRLLQWSPAAGRYGRNARNQLDLDALVVDEASMMALTQADCLLAATPADCLLILLGDKDQLASVEAGSVFADLCAKDGTESGFLLAPRVAELKVAHRFAEGGAIAELKDAINAQEPASAWQILKEGRPGLALLEFRPDTASRMNERLRLLLKQLYEGDSFKDYLKQREPEEAFKLFERFRILCSNRRGIFGVENVNRIMQELAFGEVSEELRAGQPVIITENSYGLGLYNGDVGLTLPSNGGLAVLFKTQDGFKACPPPLLPEHETAFAMTIHKAQGSGFEHTVMLLPPEPDNPLLTKELLYTAVTRAKEKLTVIASEAAFKAGVERKTERASGLAELLKRNCSLFSLA